jgi:hypothetical protein
MNSRAVFPATLLSSTDMFCILLSSFDKNERWIVVKFPAVLLAQPTCFPLHGVESRKNISTVRVDTQLILFPR